jgi:hypothetical protein
MRTPSESTRVLLYLTRGLTARDSKHTRSSPSLCNPRTRPSSALLLAIVVECPCWPCCSPCARLHFAWNRPTASPPTTCLANCSVRDSGPFSAVCLKKARHGPIFIAPHIDIRQSINFFVKDIKSSSKRSWMPLQGLWLPHPLSSTSTPRCRGSTRPRRAT